MRLAGRAGLEFAESTSEKLTAEEKRQREGESSCAKVRRIRWELLGILAGGVARMFNPVCTGISIFFGCLRPCLPERHLDVEPNL